MTAKKTTTTRRRTAKKPAEPEVQPEAEVIYEYIDDPRVGGGSPLGTLLIVVLVAAVSVMGYHIYSTTGVGPAPAPAPSPDVQPLSSLTSEIRYAMQGNEKADIHSEVLAVACRSMAGRLKDDFSARKPKYSTKQEVVEAIGSIGYFGTAAVGFDYEKLPDIIERLVRERLGEEGGPLDSDSRDDAVRLLQDLSQAFGDAF